MTPTYMGMLLKSGRVRPTYWTPHSGAGNLSERASLWPSPRFRRPTLIVGFCSVEPFDVRQLAKNSPETPSISESHSALGLSDSAFCAGSRQSRSATRSIPASSRACATWSAVSLGNPAPAREGAVQLRQQGGAEEPWPERANGQRPPIPEREGGKPCTGRALVHDQRLGRSDRGSSLYGCGRNGSCSAANPARRENGGGVLPQALPTGQNRGSRSPPKTTKPRRSGGISKRVREDSNL